MTEDLVRRCMDLSYDEAIDTRCRGCGESAAGWTFATDGRRVYVCPACVEALYRYTDGSDDGGPPHPDGQFCRACDRLTLQSDLNHQHRCPECRGAAGERQSQQSEGAGNTGDDPTPPQVQAARADAQGAVEWDSEQDG